MFRIFIIKAWSRNFVDFIGPYSIIFTLDSIHRMSQIFVIQQSTFSFVMTYCCNNIFIHNPCFFKLTTVIYHIPKRNTILSLIQEIFQKQYQVFHFSFYQLLFVWIIIIFWIRWIITKTKHFFILPLLLIDIVRFTCIDQFVSVTK